MTIRLASHPHAIRSFVPATRGFSTREVAEVNNFGSSGGTTNVFATLGGLWKFWCDPKLTADSMNIDVMAAVNLLYSLED